MPLRLETSVLAGSLLPDASGRVREQDQLKLDMGRLASVVYVRDVSGAEARVLRGSIAVGLGRRRVGAFARRRRGGQCEQPSWMWMPGPRCCPTPRRGSAASSPASSAIRVGQGYLPTSMALRARELTVGGRKLNHVVVGGGREGSLWRANLDASELNGYVEYRQPTGAVTGRLYARLARLVVAQSAAQEVESVLDEQPASIPALDIVVEDFDLRGKKLGRMEIDAVNLAAVISPSRDVPREWRLNRFNITTPEAVLTASGNWTNIVALAEAPGARHHGASAHRHEIQTRHHGRGCTARPLRYARRGTQRPRQDRGTQWLDRLAHHAGLPDAGGQLQCQCGERPVSEDRPRHWPTCWGC